MLTSKHLEIIANTGYSNIRGVGITQDRLFAIAQEGLRIAKRENEFSPKGFKHYHPGLSSEQYFELAKQGAAIDGRGTTAYIKSFDLNAEQAFEVLKIAAQQNGWGFARNLKSCPDLSTEQNLVLAEIAFDSSVRAGGKLAEQERWGSKSGEDDFEVIRLNFAARLEPQARERLEDLYERAKRSVGR